MSLRLFLALWTCCFTYVRSWRSHIAHLRPFPTRATPFLLFSAQPDNTENDNTDNDEDSALNEASLGDWRQYRAALVKREQKQKNLQSDNEGNTTPRAVAPQNQALLAQQNAALAQEYQTTVWAHSVAQPEVGGLLVRLPLAAELYYGRSSGGKSKEHEDDHKTAKDTGDYWHNRLQVLLGLESIEAEKDDDLARVERWFRVAERMVSQELESITASGLIQNGILNPQDLTDRQRSLMDKYMRYKQDWQSVSLVLSHDTPRTGCSEAVVINRPLARFVNKSLATLLMGKANDKDLPYDFLDRLVQAFGQQAAVYAGGPHAQDQPALLVHGLAELDGATELAPGLYTGGLPAAVEGVLAGTYQPLDFRFFVGRWQYDPKKHPEYGTLASRVQEGAYQCVACARSLALKQCLGLPKPLFHEVLELCGGELAAISKIELRKRIDLR